MKKILGRLLWIPIALVAVVFLVSNRQPIAVSLDPFSDQSGFLTSPALPLWLWLVLMLFLGLGLGSLGMWSSGASTRRRNKEVRQELKTLKKEMATLKEVEPSGEQLPVLKSIDP